jgi:hypothetical protein
MLGKLYEEFYLLSYNNMQSIEIQPMFWRNMLPPSSGSKNQFHAAFFLGLFFALEDGGDMFLRNIG